MAASSAPPKATEPPAPWRAEPQGPVRARRIAQRFASLPLHLAAASIAEAAERRGLRRILSIDADGNVFRGCRGRPRHNLLSS